MDIITSIIVSIAYMSLYIVSIAHITPGKASLGIAYLRAGSGVRFWMFSTLSVLSNIGMFYYMPTWLTIPTIALGAVVMVGGAIYLRRAQRQEEKQEQMRRLNHEIKRQLTEVVLDNLEVIKEARRLNREAVEALNNMDVERADMLKERAERITAHLVPR